MPPEFHLVYDDQVKSHLKTIECKYHSLIKRTIENQLTSEPIIESRDRKPLMRPALIDATWELGFGPENRFRVFYKISEERQEVYILAIGVKVRERLRIGKEVIQI